ncbi:uncharacterized protein LOC122244377 [Penaeus japonicus]|uniref:uncharacterized protein LOC122244377 n=1 Tax=Penaeus japonicus TaxID=27405 RepID=UPI001C7112B4|nr:uncharacterized protein LOC122244377 [Penaeus japonicus]
MGNCCCTTCLRPLRWTEGVRKEWLSRVPGVSEEGAADPLRSTDPQDDGPLTGTHSREEIESLIRARCDLGCQPSKDDLAREYVNPENLAAELERELLALKLHVARSHALLHHYQSSSLYGSRSEVSTPPAPPLRQTQGRRIMFVMKEICGCEIVLVFSEVIAVHHG